MTDHRTLRLAAGSLALAIATAAHSQPAATPAPAATQTEQGVIAYASDFFADSRPVTALDMIQRLPGFSFDTGSTVRGFEGGAGNVLIDGRRSLSKSEGLDDILRRIPAASVERIEIIRGGAPGVDMQGRTVLANVVRRAGGGLTGAVQTSGLAVWDGRTVMGLRAEAQRRWSDRALEGSFVLAQSIDDGVANGRRVRTDGAGAVLATSNVDGQGGGRHVALSGAYDGPLWGGRLRLNGVVQSNPFNGDIIDRFAGGDVEAEHDRTTSRGYEFGARLSHPLGPSLNSETVFLQQLGESETFVDFTSPGADRVFDLTQRTGESVLHSDLAWTRSPTLAFKFGAEGAYNWLQSHTRLLFDGAPIALPAANVRVEELRGEVLAEATWRPLANLNVEAGVHLEASTIRSSGDVALEKTLFYPKPRLLVTWSPNPAHQLRLRIEREVGQLNFGDFVAASSVASSGAAVAGNPDIVPPQSWVFEAAYEYRFWSDGVASLTLRHAQVNDVIDRIPLVVGNDVIESPGNIGDGTVDTATAELTIPLARLGLPGAQLRPSATWRHSEVTDPVTGQRRPQSALHPLDWEVHFTQDLPAWRVNWGVDVYGDYHERTFGVSEIDTFSLHTYVGVFAEYKPRPNLYLRGEVQNVTGRNSTYRRDIHDGPRDAGPVTLVDNRVLEPGPNVLVRVRQTF